MQRTIGLVAIATAMIFPGAVVAAQGRGQVRREGTVKASPAGSGQKSDRTELAAEGRRFSVEYERLIREWFSSRTNLSGLPPGLAKRETLPPGLQRQLVRNGKLPPGLQKKLHPLPHDLEILLPRLPDGRKRIVIAGNVILLEEATAAILDILTDVF